MPREEDDVVARAKRKVQRQIEEQERERKNKLLRRRIDLASAGVKAQIGGKSAEAAHHYLAYLHLLEDWKGVKEGGLTPSQFDKNKDLYELLLISGLYWDLAKMFDRTKSADKKRLFLHYLEKHIQFSKGMPFQPLCAETLRKYITNDKPVHRAEFKNAYKMLGGDVTCFIATALMEEVAEETIPVLRRFRDQRLQKSASGRVMIRFYYLAGPWAAKAVHRLPSSLRRPMGKTLDWIARKLV